MFLFSCAVFIYLFFLIILCFHCFFCVLFCVFCFAVFAFKDSERTALLIRFYFKQLSKNDRHRFIYFYFYFIFKERFVSSKLRKRKSVYLILFFFFINSILYFQIFVHKFNSIVFQSELNTSIILYINKRNLFL